MALSKAIEELLAQIKDEGDRKVLRENFEKHEFLQSRFEGNLRQEEFDRNLNKTKIEREKEQEELKVAKEYSDKMKEWASRNVPKHEELVKNYSELEAKYKDLDEKYKIAEVAAAKAIDGEGKPVDITELTKRIDETIAARGYVSKADVAKIADEEAKKMVAEEAQKIRTDFFKTDFPNALSFMSTLNDLQWRHRDEFKEPLDSKEFSKFMAESKIEDQVKAYEQYTAEKRTKVERERLTKEITEKVEKDWATKHNLPGSGAPPALEFGPVQLARMKKDTYIPADAEAGDSHVLANAAAAELRSEGKF